MPHSIVTIIDNRPPRCCLHHHSMVQGAGLVRTWMAGLNLLTDRWIPVRRGSRRTLIAPWEIAKPGTSRLDWPRADLTLGCLEFLIGLVHLADPPRDRDDWHARKHGDPERLRSRLLPFRPAFNLLGRAPRFLQDPQAASGASFAPDMLFLDGASRSA